LIAVAALLAVRIVVTAPVAEWPQWRGPARDGIAAAFEVPHRWPASLARRWSAAVGTGHSSPVVADGRVFQHTRQGDEEVVTAFTAEDGRQVWRDAYPAPYRVNEAARAHGPGPKSTPVVSGQALCTFGISGILTCYDAATGRVRWRVQPVKDQPIYGTAMSPLIIDDAVIAHVGGHESGALTAFDLRTGRRRWQWTGGAPAYASPVVGTLGGVQQIVTQSRTHVVGISAADGQLLWQIAFTTSYDQNAVTPLIVDDLVVFSGLSSGTTAVRPRLDGRTWRADQVWKNADVAMYMSSPIRIASQVFGLSHRNRGQFFALDLQTGQTKWTTRGREAENASLVATGDTVLASTTNGELVVFRAGAAGLSEARRYELAQSPIWAHPALAGRRIFVKDAENLTAWDVPRS
jgi:outer membrane protein assembly factor BamB